MPKISQHRRDARRQQILDAALACFSEEGFHQTGIAEIVRRSGLSHGAVYGYFPSKDDIIEALADDRHQREALLNAVALQTRDPIDGLHRLVRAYGAWLSDPAGAPGRRVGVHGWGEALRNDRVKALVRAGVDVPRATIAELIERGQLSGQISRRVSADAVARLLVALFQGLVLQVSWGESIDIDACVTAVDHLLEGLVLANRPTHSQPAERPE
jgi:AcrR family transcriptional regulator